jgi:hypothetical protein
VQDKTRKKSIFSKGWSARETKKKGMTGVVERYLFRDKTIRKERYSDAEPSIKARTAGACHESGVGGHFIDVKSEVKKEVMLK